LPASASPRKWCSQRSWPDRLIEFAPTNRFFRLFLPSLSFRFEPEAKATRFVAQIVPRMGPIARRLHRKELALVRQHMRGEGENLKRMIESGVRS
jgi:hypothetical protein